MINTISRPVNDDRFSFSLLEELVSSVDCEYDAYHIWTMTPKRFKKFLGKTDFGQSPNAIIAIKDGLDMWEDYNFWHSKCQAGIHLLDDTAAKFPTTNFVVLTSLEDVHKEKITSPNLQFVSWGGDLMNQYSEYQNLEPVLEKNFESDRVFISLNRHKRDHRIMLVSYLFGQGLEQYGNITFLQCLPQSFKKEFLDEVFWEFDIPRHDHFRSIVISGYDRMLKNSDSLLGEYDIYPGDDNDNIENFNTQLRPMYRDSFVEIITETTFCSPAYHLTEKTWHAFSGCNFPIFLFGQGGVQHLRDMGFDVFDDVVCHAYDNVSNPIDRIMMAIEMNKGLLTNLDLVKDLWEVNRHRFGKNIEVTQTLGEKYRKRAIEHWSQLRWNR